MAKQIERFEVKTIKRSEIKLADYNPRYIDEGAKKRLKKGIKKLGLLSPLIWNKKTGVLVSGHQRLLIMDEMQHYPEKGDYDISVAVVELTEAEEREANVNLNNQSMMGDFDYDMLRDLSNFDGVNLDDLGFSEADMDLIWGADDGKMANIVGDSPEVQDAKKKLQDIKQERQDMKKRKDAENSASYYFVVVCDNAKERQEMFEKMGVPLYEEFVTADKLRKLAD